jgi:hypothetical protein
METNESIAEPSPGGGMRATEEGQGGRGATLDSVKTGGF